MPSPIPQIDTDVLTVVDLVRRGRASTRQQLAQMTGMGRNTISSLLNTAVSLGLVAPALLQMLAHLLGFQVPSNFLFLLAILLLLGVSLHLSLEISRLEDETRVLAEHVAILDLMLSKLSPPSDRASGEEPPSARREP